MEIDFSENSKQIGDQVVTKVPTFKLTLKQQALSFTTHWILVHSKNTCFLLLKQFLVHRYTYLYCLYALIHIYTQYVHIYVYIFTYTHCVHINMYQHGCGCVLVILHQYFKKIVEVKSVYFLSALWFIYRQ